MVRRLIPLAVLMLSGSVMAQVGIGTERPASVAQLEIAANHRGVLLTRVELVKLDSQEPIQGEMVESLLVYHKGGNNIDPGFYYWKSGIWNQLLSGETYKDRKNNTFTIGENPDKNNEESLIITDTENHSVYLAIGDIANNKTFVEQIASNQDFITKLGDNLEFVTQIINNNEFIENIINELEEAFGNAFFDVDENKFYYYDENKNKQWVDWSKLDTENVSFTLVGDQLVVKDSKENTVSLAVADIANNKTFVEQIASNQDFITKLGDKDEFKTLIKDNAPEATLTISTENEGQVKAGFTFNNGKDSTDIQFAETLTKMSKGADTDGNTEYYFIDERGEASDVTIQVTADIIADFDKIINNDTVSTLLKNLIKESAGDVTISRDETSKDLIIQAGETTFNLTDEIRSKESLTSLEFEKQTIGTGEEMVDHDFLVYTPERGEAQRIDLTTLVKSSETLTSLLTKEDEQGLKVPAVYIYTDENKKAWEINIPEALKQSEVFNDYIDNNFIANIPSTVVNYSGDEVIKPEKWLDTNKEIAQRVFDIQLRQKTNVIEVPGDFASVILQARLINQRTNLITEGVIRKTVVNGNTQIIVGVGESLTVYHPIDKYYLILEYVKK